MKSFIHGALKMRDKLNAGTTIEGSASLVENLNQMFARGSTKLRVAIIYLILVVMACLGCSRMASAFENPLYTVTGVEVDVRAETAAQAKKQAITEANVKAFALFVRRVGGDAIVDKLSKIPPKRIDAMLDSLSIEEERTGPKRYIGKLTVRFLPGKLRKLLAGMGVTYSEKMAARTVIIPLWRTVEGMMIWEENPWRTAWLSLRLENSPVPLIVPLGDLADLETLTPELVANRDEASLEAIRLRYEADSVLIAEAAATSEDTVQATLVGDSPVGKLEFDKAYTAENGGGIDEAATTAALRFHQVLLQRWKKKNETGPVTQSLPIATLPVAVAFVSTEEWSALRARILSTPGISGVDISTISQGGAIVQLSYVTGFEQLRQSLWSSGLALQNVGGTWVLQAS